MFQKVTGLTLKDFELLVSLNVFNANIMNEAVYRFKLYEDSSLEYTGINKHAAEEDVGLFSTVISKEEYDKMAEEQRKSMTGADAVHTATSIKKAFKGKTGAASSESKARPSGQKNKHSESEPEFAMPQIEVGTKVNHIKFGTGEVTEIYDGKIRVSFTNGEKLLTVTAFQNGFMKIL